MMCDRVEFLRGLLLPLPAQLDQDPAGATPASSKEFGAICAEYLVGRCGRDEVLRAAACRMRRELPRDIGEVVAAE
ncbi:hypothetical protein BZM27_09385 [Paraburkholderia steynii]|uniref:Uncharacterized protein n=1 Tax=Paraburkholderia steynii TaxID=1245441 RepID=A0A4R0XED7_9BURK|nr:hypothetical protein BZM27_09385 [Paraburkholderia steynii]